MMGVGSSGHGGSSSSSNLSALAQPFTVDRSILKPNPNPHFSESPYTFAFKPTLDDWLHLHPLTSVPDSFSKPNLGGDSICANAVPYGYFGSESINSPTTHLPSSNPATTTATGVTSLFEAKPYYPRYPSPTIPGNSPSVVLNEPGCDGSLLSTSSVSPIDSSAQNDCTQSSSGFGYTAQWGGFWNGLPDGEHGRRMELDGSFCSKEKNGAGSSTYQSFLNQGALAAEDLGNCQEASAVSCRKYIDILGRKCHLGSIGAEPDAKCYSLPEGNPNITPFNFSRTSVLGSISLQEMPNPQVPSAVSVMNSWSHLNPNTASYRRCFTQLDSCTTDPTVSHSSATNSSTVLVSGPPVVGTSSALNTISLKNVNSSGNDAFDNNEDSVGHTFSNGMEPHLPLNAKGKEDYCNASRFSIGMNRNDHIYVESSSMKKDKLPNNKPVTNDAFDTFFKAKSELQVPRLNLPDAFTLAPGGAEAADSVENSSETFDQYNPAVDSPCWKGALASRHSPFGVSDTATPQLLLKELEACNVLNLQGPQIFSFNVDDAVTVSSQKLQENVVYHEIGCVEDGSSPFLKRRSSVVSSASTEQRSKDVVKAGSYHSKVRSGNEIHCSDGIQEPTKQYALPNNSKISFELKPSHTMQLSLEEYDLTSEKQLASEASVADAGMNIKDAKQNSSSCIQFYATEHIASSSPSGDSVPTELIEPHGGASKTLAEYTHPKMDVRMLVNAMHNLSELLLCSCPNGIGALQEQDHEVLQHVINNLDACIIKKVGQMAPISKSRFPHPGPSNCPIKLSDLCKGAGIGRSQVIGVEASNVQHQLDYPKAHEEGKRHSTVASKKDNKLQYFVSSSGDADIEKDDVMTQAIEKVLKENFHDEEDAHPQTLLYKNLWLEAEAALCSMNYKARFDRVKIEIEKSKLHQTKDVAGKASKVEKLSTLNVSSDLNMDDMLAREKKEIPNPGTHIWDAAQSSITNHAEGIESSVMARSRILKCRVDNPSSFSKEVQLPNLVYAGAYAGMEEMLSSPCPRGAQNVGMKPQPAKHVDLGFTENRPPWPFIRYRSVGSSEVN